MDGEKIIDEVGKFYATIYDNEVDFLERFQDRLVEIPCNTRE